NALPDLGQRKGERPLQIGQGIVEGPDGAVAARADLERRRLIEEVVDGELDADIAQICARRRLTGLVADRQIEIDRRRAHIRIDEVRPEMLRAGKARTRRGRGRVEAWRYQIVAVEVDAERRRVGAMAEIIRKTG